MSLGHGVNVATGDRVASCEGFPTGSDSVDSRSWVRLRYIVLVGKGDSVNPAWIVSAPMVKIMGRLSVFSLVAWILRNKADPANKEIIKRNAIRLIQIFFLDKIGNKSRLLITKYCPGSVC